MSQQNPNILIQTGQSEPGPHTVLINLNTLPQHQNANTQPHTVQVSLNANPPPSSGQRNPNPRLYNDHQNNTLQQELATTSQSNLHHVSASHSNPRTRMDSVPNAAQPAHSTALRNGQPRDRHVTNQTRSRRNTENTYPYSERTRTQIGRTLSVDVDDLDDDTYLRQMPWDLMHGTPSYPNRQVDSYESQNSTQQNSSLCSEDEHAAPAQRPRRSPVDAQVRNISRASRRNFLRQLAHSTAQRRSRVDRNVPRQFAQPDVTARPRADQQSRTAPQNIAPYRHGVDNMNIAVPVPQQPTVQMQTAQPTRLISQSGPDQRQSGPPHVATPNPLMLTQAALQQHTSQIPVPFVNRNQQTQAALEHPGTQATPAQILPARQINQTGQVAPPPPPVLHPNEFKTLPREHLQRPRVVKPVQAMRRPVVVHHGHRPPNMPRHPRTMRTNLHKHPVNPHMHANAHWHGRTQDFPVHMSQVRPTLQKDFFISRWFRSRNKVLQIGLECESKNIMAHYDFI